MTRTIAALLAAAATLSVAMPATAQTKYYARERIVGVPIQTTPTFVATYKPFGACSGTTQTAEVDTCTSNGAPVATSSCQARTRTCEVPVKPADYYSCTGARYDVDIDNGMTNLQRVDLGAAADEAGAIALCNARSSDASRPNAVCFWNPGPKLAFLFRAPAPIQWKTTSSAPGWWRSCSNLR